MSSAHFQKLLFLALAILFTASAPLSPGIQASQQSPDPQPLAPGQPLERDLKGGETHAYIVTLAASQLLRAVVDQRGIDVVAKLFAPDGKQLLEVDSPNGARGPEPVAVVSETAGVYRLEVISLEAQARPGRYEIKIAELRTATAQDRVQVTFEQLIRAGETARAALTVAGLRQGVEKFQAALTLWRANNGAYQQEAKTLLDIAGTYSALYERFNGAADKEQAAQFYQQAIQTNRTANDRKAEVRALINLANAQQRWREFPQAIASFQQVLTLSRESNDPQGAGAALFNIGVTHATVGRMEEALTAYQEALPYFRTANDRRSEGVVLNSVALAYRLLGDNRRALMLAQQLLNLRRELKDLNGERTTLNQLAQIYRDLGELQQALDTFNQALALSRAANNQEDIAIITLNLGALYEMFGLPRTALDHFQQALPLLRAANIRQYEAAALSNIGKVYQTLNEPQKALEHLQQAMPLMRASKDPRGEAGLLMNLGRLRAQAGDRTEAFALFNQALTITRSIKYSNGEALALNRLGWLHQQGGEKQQALAQHRQALPLVQALGDQRAEAETRASIARVESDLGNLQEAKTQIEAALQIIETLRTRLATQELRTSYFATVQNYYDFYIDLLMRMRSGQQQSGELESAALQVSERARARSLLELLNEARADIRQGVDAALAERERETQQLLNGKAEQLLRQQGTRPTDDPLLVKLRSEVDALTNELQQVRAEIKNKNPRYAALTQPQPLTRAEIQKQVLDNETLLLEYALGEERSYLWAVTATTLRSYQLPPRKDIETAAQRLYQLLSTRPTTPEAGEDGKRSKKGKDDKESKDDEYWQAASTLSQMILGPVAEQLKAAHKQRLLIVADGALQYLPFAALPRPKTKGGLSRKPLLASYEIVNLPSASTIAVLRQEVAGRAPAPKAVAVIADPVFDRKDERAKATTVETAAKTAAAPEDIPRRLIRKKIAGAAVDAPDAAELRIARLPFTRNEAERIAALAPAGQAMTALDFQANRAAITSKDLSQYRIVHLATHGLLDSERPELSALLLSLVDEKGQPQDGFLRAHEIFNLNLPVELVVLSACETGLGQQVRGEGLVGLTRGFMYAGAPRVVVSLWAVSDRATSELMARFYSRMLKGGEKPAAALRAAQVELAKDKRWQHPYYWAAFTLQGEWR